ncbi:hypothetical protein Btru_017240 [Bulinus truncatus]|nr:hypothetical protein Btru_017240 [Bulinus truncatus]
MAEKISASQVTKALKNSSTFQVLYLGSLTMDRLYSQTMQPWVMAEVRRKREHIKDVTIEVSKEVLHIRGTGQEENTLLLEHNVKGITRFAKLHQDPRCFAYLTRYQLNADFECHVFLANSEDIIPKIFNAIREATKDVNNSKPTDAANAVGGTHPEAGFDWEGGEQSRSLFEVKYMGRAKVASKRVTAEYIDCLAEKMIAREEDLLMKRLEEREEKIKQHSEEQHRVRHSSETSSMSDTLESEVFIGNQLGQQKLTFQQSGQNSSTEKALTKGNEALVVPAHLLSDTNGPKQLNLEFASDSDSSRENLNLSFEQPLTALSSSPRFLHSSSLVSDPLGVIPIISETAKFDPTQATTSTSPVKVNPQRRRHSSHREEGNIYYVSDRFRRASGDSVDSLCSVCEPSRVMVLQISHQDLSLISLDKKGAILECKFQDISSVSQGKVKQDIFGIVARDGSVFICYILKCLTDAVVSEIMSTLQTAFTAAYSKKTAASTNNNNASNVSATPSTTQVCTMCPLHQLHRISQEISHMSPQAAYDLLIKKIKNLTDKDYNDIIHQLEVSTKITTTSSISWSFIYVMQAESAESLDESVEVLMIGLRQLCERKQKEHTHISSESHKQASTEINLLEEKTKLFEGFRSKARKSLTTSFETLLRLTPVIVKFTPVSLKLTPHVVVKFTSVGLEFTPHVGVKLTDFVLCLSFS